MRLLDPQTGQNLALGERTLTSLQLAHLYSTFFSRRRETDRCEAARYISILERCDLAAGFEPVVVTVGQQYVDLCYSCGKGGSYCSASSGKCYAGSIECSVVVVRIF